MTRTLVRSDATSTDVVLTFMHPLLIVLVRVVRVYLQSFLGFLLAGQVGLLPAVPAQALLGAVASSAAFALAPALICLVQNSLELLTSIDTSLPQVRG